MKYLHHCALRIGLHKSAQPPPIGHTPTTHTTSTTLAKRLQSPTAQQSTLRPPPLQAFYQCPRCRAVCPPGGSVPPTPPWPSYPHAVIGGTARRSRTARGRCSCRLPRGGASVCRRP